MLKTITLYSAILALLSSNGADNIAGKNIPGTGEKAASAIPTFSQSFDLFKDVCFRPLPFSEDFFDAIEATNIEWRKLRKDRESKLGKGDSWSAKEGRVDYQFLSSNEFSVTDPACDFEFTVGQNFDHELARQEISTFLILDSKNTSDKDALEACWQGILDDGRHIRFRLMSGFEQNGESKARLSIGYIKKFPLNLENRLRRNGQLECQ